MPERATSPRVTPKSRPNITKYKNKLKVIVRVVWVYIFLSCRALPHLLECFAQRERSLRLSFDVIDSPFFLFFVEHEPAP